MLCLVFMDCGGVWGWNKNVSLHLFVIWRCVFIQAVLIFCARDFFDTVTGGNSCQQIDKCCYLMKIIVLGRSIVKFETVCLLQSYLLPMVENLNSWYVELLSSLYMEREGERCMVDCSGQFKQSGMHFRSRANSQNIKQKCSKEEKKEQCKQNKIELKCTNVLTFFLFSLKVS